MNTTHPRLEEFFAVVRTLDRAGVPIVDYWTQTDDDTDGVEGLIELVDDEDTGALAIAWHSQRGWTRLRRDGPQTPDAFSKYSNVEDLVSVDVARQIILAGGYLALARKHKDGV